MAGHARRAEAKASRRARRSMRRARSRARRLARAVARAKARPRAIADSVARVAGIAGGGEAGAGGTAGAGAGAVAARAAAGGERASEFAHRTLLESIEAVAGRRDVALRDPARDFTRHRKVSLADLPGLLVFASEDTTGAELCDRFGWEGGAPSASALTQLRKKLSPRAMPELLRELLSHFDPVPYLGRYRLLAADGTGVGIARNADKRTEVTSNQHGRHRNEMHPTLVFDAMAGAFEDMVVQGSKVQNEPRALCELVDRVDPGVGPDGRRLTPLWLADRGYCTYNTLAHMVGARASFCLRCSDSWAKAYLGEDLPEGEFDLTVERFLTRSERTDRRSRPDKPELYHVIDSRTPLDALPKGSRDEFRLRLRVVRVAIPAAEDRDEEEKAKKKRGTGNKAKGVAAKKNWLTLVTNLTEDDGFDVAALVALYKNRWKEEVGIRFLKHTCGMKDPRCRDYDRAEQEIWGRVILASACALAMAGVEAPKPGPKHERAVDVTMAFKAFLRMLGGRRDVNLEAVCERLAHSVRPGRSFERHKSKESRVHLCYRH